jgi:hypothetical protein
VQFIDGTASLNISEEAFINCTKLSGELNIIDRITNIGINAFLRTKFSDISIGSNNVNYALAKNVGAAKVVIAINTNNGNLDYAGSLNNVIGSLAVGQLTIQGSPDAFKDGLFYCCQGLTGQLTIPNSITTIGERAFGGCIGLVGNLVIPDTVTTIGNLAFEYCSGLNGAITIGQSVSTIGKQAFAAVPINNINNRSTNFVFANNVGNARVLIPANTNNGSLDYATNINDVVGKLAYGSLTIPNDVTTIKEDLFSTCYGMNGMLTFGNNVTTINQRAFLGCRFSGALTLPNSLIVIANGVFEGCTNFNGTLFLPDSITTIEPFAFNGCKNFKVIDVTTWTSLPAISNQAFLQWSSTGTIYVPPNNPLNISYSTFKSLSSGWVTVIK